MKYRLEKTRNKITDLQNFAQKIVDFDAEIEREMSHFDFR